MREGPTRARPPLTIVRYAKARIDVLRGPDRGTVIEVAGAPIRVGTALDNDLVLSDDTVSRNHCEIEVTDGGIRVRDAGSTNGIVVLGMRVYDALLPFEARLRLGETEIAVVPLGVSVEREQITGERFGDILGRSRRMRELFADLDRLANVEVTVLVEGETGVGKDLVAESLHRMSPRCEGPLAIFDCSAVSPQLIESELFGHERGAFTGAQTTRAGVLERAHGGTLFLDEIGELPKDLQPKLLRVLESRDVRRVGGSKVYKVDMRVVAATNRNLRAEVQRGAFREDLYFRLAGAHVRVPALRDRMEDIPLLVEHFLALEGASIRASDIPRHIWDLFSSHRWPGNVRELRNSVRRLLVTPDRPLDTALYRRDQPAPAAVEAPILPLPSARREAMDAFERDYLHRVLSNANGNVSRAAVLADVSRQMLQKLIRKHGRETGD